MKVNTDTLNYLAKLAKLDLAEEEKEQLLIELNNILTFVEQLQEVNTDNVEPLVFINENENGLRADEIVQNISQADALKNAPLKNESYFLVPKVIG